MKLHKFISMNKVIISRFLAIGLLLGCKKKEKEPDLPPITSTGENTFGCYIDGEPYAIFEGTPNPWKLTWTKVTNFSTDSMLYIQISNEDPRWGFDIAIKNFGELGAFDSKNFPFQSAFTDYKNGGTMPTYSNHYETKQDYFLTFKITKAIPYRHYAGTFSGEMINGDGKVIQITDGRFDIKK